MHGQKVKPERFKALASKYKDKEKDAFKSIAGKTKKCKKK